MRPELSIIIPYCNEWPQVVFTIRNIMEELRDRVAFEIIAVNNYCGKILKKRKIEEDRGYLNIKNMAENHSWLRSLYYYDKLSHWNAKNMGVLASKGKYLWFVDAHCIVSRDGLFNMFNYFKENHEELNGTLHLPLTYHILEKTRLIYRLNAKPVLGYIHYTFTDECSPEEVYEVPCMSCCGVMMTRNLYDELEGWPSMLGAYGGGENFLNFTLAVLGKKKHIYNNGTLYHHGDKRGYHWDALDYMRNLVCATYIFGGEKLAKRLIDCQPQRYQPHVLYSAYISAVGNEHNRRQRVKEKQVISILDWVEQWKEENEVKKYA